MTPTSISNSYLSSFRNLSFSVFNLLVVNVCLFLHGLSFGFLYYLCSFRTAAFLFWYFLLYISMPFESLMLEMILKLESLSDGYLPFNARKQSMGKSLNIGTVLWSWEALVNENGRTVHQALRREEPWNRKRAKMCVGKRPLKWWHKNPESEWKANSCNVETSNSH